MLAARLLDAFLVTEAIALIDPVGVSHHCGPRGVAPDVTVRLRESIPVLHLLRTPQVAIGESYMRGTLVIERGTLRQLMAIVFKTLTLHRETTFARLMPMISSLRSAASRFAQWNSRAASRWNVEYHYDIGNELFELILDPSLQYTCGQFPAAAMPVGTTQALAAYGADPARDLDAAQRRRIEQIISKLRIGPDMRVLDIGSGWGGLATAIAERTGADVLGITLSPRQLEYARTLAAARGLAARARFELLDYRSLSGRFDRIIAAGVLEHIGKAHHATFFRRIGSLLSDDGSALVDSTGRADRPGNTNPWLRKYIFPGGYIPALSEVCTAVERSGLEMLDVDIARLHYAFTVREWERRLAASADRIRALMGAEFVRMYELYLASSEMAFVHGRFVNFQLLVSNSRFAAPITREFMMEPRHGAEEVAPGASGQHLGPGWHAGPVADSCSGPAGQPDTLVLPRASQ
jgi:cyclopropane-fatty-acyl-phospholipid synthase